MGNNSKENLIYLDNAATTCSLSGCMDIIQKYTFSSFYNPSATYSKAIEVKKDLEKARKNILNKLNGSEGKLVFTSSGSEANNIALSCLSIPKGSKIIVGNAEHSSVFNVTTLLKSLGYNICFAPVNLNGQICLEKFKQILTPDTKLVSIMHVNNETGAVNDIKLLNSLSKCANKNIIFHADGVQAVGKIPVDMKELDVDLYSISAHKFGGIKGAAALYAKSQINIKPFIYGGGQELNIRSSTENITAILCMELALIHKLKKLEDNIQKTKSFQQKLNHYFSKLDNIKILTKIENSNYHIFSFAMKKVKSEIMQHILEENKIFVGTGSACNSSKHNLRISNALKLGNEYKHGIIRLSFSEETNEEQIQKFLNIFSLEYNKIYNQLNSGV
ncbi:MAG: cysteine desulfurase family protein [Christensenellales bacterium]|jgi:cysteine desulfurase|nr:cysteine desulfurase [Clostridiales bacterium]